MSRHVPIGTVVRCAVAALALAGGYPIEALRAQDRLVGGIVVSGGPVFQTWSFAAPVPIDSLRVRSATQLVLPVTLQTSLGSAWTASLTGAAVRGSITTDVLSSKGSSAEETRRLDGLTDLRLRATGRVRGEGLVLSLGLNIPTGGVGLDPRQTEALRVLGAPALDARAPVLGTGFGATVGVVGARTVGVWAWAAGAAFERRGSYAPIEASIAGGGTRSTRLDPGDVVHLSLGGDGVVGEGRMGLNLVVDLYGQDAVTLPIAGNQTAQERYRLGPTVGASWQWQLAPAGLRELTLTASNRYRAAYTGPDGAAVLGSNGNYFDASAAGVIGAPGRVGLLLGADVRQHTGLSADKGFIGAGTTAGGLTAGLVVPAGRAEWRPWVRGTAGQLRTAIARTSMTALSAGLSLTAR